MTKLRRCFHNFAISLSTNRRLGPLPNIMSAPRYNVLIDLNGTCHIGDKPTDGAVEAIQKLRAAQQEHQGRLNIRFCSNTSKESSSSLLSRLRRVGLGADLVSAHDVFTSLDAAKRLVSRRKLRALLLLSQSAQSSFTEEPNLTEDFFLARPEMDPATLSPDEKSRLRSCNAVVIGLCPELMTQKWLDEAFRLLSGEYGATEQVALIATHCAMYHRPSEGAPLSMGPGAFVSALEAACRRDADSTTVCGKPSQAFLQECIAGMIAADESMNDYTNIIIGDDLDADLGKGTWQLGLRRILVRTGKFRAGDDVRGEKPADEVYDSFASWVEGFISTELNDGQ